MAILITPQNNNFKENNQMLKPFHTSCLLFSQLKYVFFFFFLNFDTFVICLMKCRLICTCDWPTCQFQ